MHSMRHPSISNCLLFLLAADRGSIHSGSPMDRLALCLPLGLSETPLAIQQIRIFLHIYGAEKKMVFSATPPLRIPRRNNVGGEPRRRVAQLEINESHPAPFCTSFFTFVLAFSLFESFKSLISYTPRSGAHFSSGGSLNEQLNWTIDASQLVSFLKRRASYTAAVSYLIVIRFRHAENPIPAIPPRNMSIAGG